MLDLDDCRAKARQLIVLANVSETEAERQAYYELAQVWLSAISSPKPGQAVGDPRPSIESATAFV